MRTAQEMRVFAAGFNVVGDVPGAVKLERCPFEKIEEALMPDEQVLFSFGALHEKAIALTNRRLIHAETKDPAHDQAGGLYTYSYDPITSVFSGNMQLIINMDGCNSLFYGNLAIDRIREAAELIGDIIGQYESTPAPAGAAKNSAADELRKYKELLDMGAITQEEFEAKKHQLLSL